MNINLVVVLRCFVFALMILSNSAQGGGGEGKQFRLADVQIKKYVNGQVSYGINLRALNYFLIKMHQHALYYPPNFKSKGEEALVRSQLKVLLAMQKKAYPNTKYDLNLVGRYAYSLAMAYNLDMVTDKNEVISVYEQALSLSPNNPYVNRYYGIFLSQLGSESPDIAIPYFKKAIQSGAKIAKWDLATRVYLLDKTTLAEGIKLLKEYIQDFPEYDMKNVKEMIKSLESGKGKIERGYK